MFLTFKLIQPNLKTLNTLRPQNIKIFLLENKLHIRAVLYNLLIPNPLLDSIFHIVQTVLIQIKNFKLGRY